MFDVVFYSFAKRENSTKTPAGAGTTYQCKLLAPSSITDPVIELSGVANPASFTYASIPSFSRSYFIKDWQSSGPLWICYLTVDVLASYKTEIGSSSQYVLRAASDISPNAIDTFYKATMETEYLTSLGTVNFTEFDTQDGVYMIHSIGLFDTGVGDTENYLLFNKAEYKKFLKAVTIDQAASILGHDYLSRLIEVKWLPLKYTALSQIMFPDRNAEMDFLTTPTGGLACKAIEGSGIVFGQALITIPRPSWYSADRHWCLGAPYAEYTLSWYPFGLIELDSAKIAASSGTITMWFYIDTRTGNSKLQINSAGGYLGTDIALMAANEAVHAASTNGGAYLSAGAGIATAAIGAYTGQYAMAAGGITAAIGSIESMRKGIHTVKGNVGSRVAIEDKPALYVNYFKPTDDNHAEYGYPLCEIRQISTLSGFVLCAEGDIELSCTDAERSKVMGYLTGGFYYE